jgi:LDH2 family malate/lactate/ureidoglycolate dehydrogenase
MVTKSSQELSHVIRTILDAAGADSFNAECVTEHLVASNLCGVDTHGLWHLPLYVEWLRDGQVDATARPEVSEPSMPSAARILGRWAFGQVAARMAMEVAIEKALAAGVAVVTVVEVNHIGRLGHYLEMAARRELIAIVLGSGYGRIAPRAAPFGGRQRILDTNPFAIGVPLASSDSGADPECVLLDYATTASSAVKVKNARRRNQPLPPGFIVDSKGRPSTNPNDFFEGGALAPFGGHKGYSLMLAIEMLGGFFAGSDAFARDDRGTELFRHQGVTMIVLQAGLFQPFDEFARHARAFAEKVRASQPAEGSERVLVPGDLERRARRQRAENGIPIEDDVWQSVVEAARTVGVDIS